MARSRITLDHEGLAEILKSDEVAGIVGRAAERTAGKVRSASTIQRHGAEVVVDHYTTDRAAASVTIKHPGGRNMEAKYGTLTGGAAAAGLEVSDGSS